VFQESSEEKNRRKNCKVQIVHSNTIYCLQHVLMCVISSLSALTYDMEKHCNTEIAAKVVRVSSNPNGM
jgi:transmembrane E3 ubiquitin-protein ligase